MLARNIEAPGRVPEVSGDRMISRLRTTCALAIDAYGSAPSEKRLAILMLIYRLQDHIARARIRELLASDPPLNAWVDTWKPD